MLQAFHKASKLRENSSKLLHCTKCKDFHCIQKAYTSIPTVPSSSAFDEENAIALRRRITEPTISTLLDVNNVMLKSRIHRTLHPLAILGQDNSLCDSCSYYSIGIMDNSGYFRKLLIDTINETKTNSPLYVRWKKDYTGQNLSVENDVVELEWDKLTFQASAWHRPNKLPQLQNNRNTLRHFHVFVMANICRRAIIVISIECTDTMRSGIFLPLCFPPEECVRTPIYLAYHERLFVPLLFEEEYDEFGKLHDPVIPLANMDFVMFEIPYLMENENRTVCLQEYLFMTTIYHSTETSVEEVPAAKIPSEALAKTLYEPLGDPRQILHMVFSLQSQGMSPKDCAELWKSMLSPNIGLHETDGSLNQSLETPTEFFSLQPQCDHEEEEEEEEDEGLDVPDNRAVSSCSREFHRSDSPTPLAGESPEQNEDEVIARSFEGDFSSIHSELSVPGSEMASRPHLDVPQPRTYLSEPRHEVQSGFETIDPLSLDGPRHVESFSRTSSNQFGNMEPAADYSQAYSNQLSPEASFSYLNNTPERTSVISARQEHPTSESGRNHPKIGAISAAGEFGYKQATSSGQNFVVNNRSGVAHSDKPFIHPKATGSQDTDQTFVKETTAEDDPYYHSGETSIKSSEIYATGPEASHQNLSSRYSMMEQASSSAPYQSAISMEPIVEIKFTGSSKVEIKNPMHIKEVLPIKLKLAKSEAANAFHEVSAIVTKDSYNDDSSTRSDSGRLALIVKPETNIQVAYQRTGEKIIKMSLTRLNPIFAELKITYYSGVNIADQSGQIDFALPMMEPLQEDQSTDQVTLDSHPTKCRTAGCLNLGSPQKQKFCSTCYTNILKYVPMKDGGGSSGSSSNNRQKSTCKNRLCDNDADPKCRGYCFQCYNRTGT